MSIQPFIDPHPGRCRNVRPSNDGERDTSRRCLERDAHDSACRFTDLPSVRHPDYGRYIVGVGQPEPWVVPVS